jgi:transposase
MLWLAREGAMPVFREYDQGQGVFRSIRPNELLEPDHPARVVDKVVEMLDLGEVYAEYAEEGSPPYHPQMMLKVMFYAYHRGLMSSRKIWDGLKERADFIFLSGDQVPDFRTINDFRTRHMKVLPKLFAQIVMICVRLGMLDFQNLAVVGESTTATTLKRKTAKCFAPKENRWNSKPWQHGEHLRRPGVPELSSAAEVHQRQQENDRG